MFYELVFGLQMSSLIAESVGLSFNFNDGCVMKEAVEDGGSSGDITDEFSPFFKRSVGGHEGGFDFISAHDDLEEVFARFRRKLFDAHVVDDEQVALEVSFLHSLVKVFGAGLMEIVEDVEDGPVEDEFALLDELVADCLGDVAFADTRRTNEEDVLTTSGKITSGELVNLFSVDVVEGKVEAIEGTLFAEGSGLVAAVDEAFVSDIELVLQERFKELLMGKLMGSCFLQAQVQGTGQAA